MAVKPHIAVLLGGISAEREVSLNSGKAVVKALERQGYKVTGIDVGADLAEKLKAAKPDAVFNALHGKYGEDGCVQGVLEIMGLPYTHSGVLASSMAMHKPTAKIIFQAAGIPTAEGKVVSKEEALKADPLPRPFILKPIDEGSSVGVKFYRQGDNQFITESDWSYGGHVLAERCMDGREVQVAVLNDQALGAIEIRPKNAFYDYEAKYTVGKADHLMPAPIRPDAYEQVCRYAEMAHKALGCRGLSRSDFIYYGETETKPGKFVILELNTQPGMTELSLSPEIAAHAGITFDQLVTMLVEEALKQRSIQVESERRHG
ncbi:D-alanine--D-alanine ligase [bacterium]|nr:D-alanine--D-alanine ligase [bacterium]